MKKKLLLFLVIFTLSLFIGSIKVNALSSLNMTYYYNNYEDNINIADNYSSVISNLTSYYDSNLSSEFDYYFIATNYIRNTTMSNNLICLQTILNTEFQAVDIQSGGGSPVFSEKPNNQFMPGKSYCYNISEDTYVLTDSPGTHTFSSIPYYANTDLTLYGINNAIIPQYSDLTLDVSYPSLTLNIGDVIPTYMSITNGQSQSDFTEVDLSDYEYIILSLKDYDIQPFNTIIYTQGSLCFTPVYNYGMTQKQEYFNGYQVQGCTEVYSSSTPVSVYIIQSDIDYHSVYYIKQQSNVPTVLNIPTSIFNITYFTSQNANSPQVVIDNKSYPVIPYSQLTDTANISSDTGYISGQTCALGDINCFEQVNSVSFDDIFSKPLESLKTLWSSITSVFNVITAFITLLPPPLQTFLYISFMISIMIGILKIIL